MKTIIPTVLFLVLGISLSANTMDTRFSEDDCRETAVYDNITITASARVALDLSSGIWTRGHRAGAEATVYEFHESGLLEIVTPDAAGTPLYESYLWRVEEYNNQAFLVLTSSDFKREMLYQTLPTCQGMVLIDPVSIDQISLEYHKDPVSSQNQNLTAQLNGTWTSAVYPYDLTNSFDDCGAFEPIEGAYLSYEFRPDGTFTKHYGSKAVHLEDDGFYEVFGDGQYIVFHVKDANEQYHQHVARIKYLAYGEMVLEQALESNDFAGFFCSQLKSVTFVQ